MKNKETLKNRVSEVEKQIASNPYFKQDESKFSKTFTDYYSLKLGTRTRSGGYQEVVYRLTFFSEQYGEGRQICFVLPNQLQQIIEEYAGWPIIIETSPELQKLTFGAK